MKPVAQEARRPGMFGYEFALANCTVSPARPSLAALFSPTAGAQEILPFPPTPSASTPGLTMQDSIYKKRVEPKRLPMARRTS